MKNQFNKNVDKTDSVFLTWICPCPHSSELPVWHGATPLYNLNDLDQITIPVLTPWIHVNDMHIILYYFLHKVFDKTLDNATLVLQIDNARLAADDFKVKYVELFYFCQKWI